MLIWNCLLSAVLAAGATEFEVQTIDGRSAVGRVTQLNAQELVLDTADGPAKFGLGTLAGLARKPPAAIDERKASVRVELLEGSILAATDYTVRGGTAHLVLTAGAKLEVPTRVIRSVRFGPAADRDPKLTKQWSQITESKADGDLLVVRKNGALDYLEGVLGDMDADTCSFELDKETFSFKRPKVEGVVYFHPQGVDLPEATGYLVATDGSRWALRTAELAEDSFKVTTPSGISLEVSLEQVARFDFSSGKIVYLSDVEPESATYVPFLGLAEEPQSFREYYQYRRDIGFEQNPLRLDGKTYRKGLSLASRTMLVYKLPGKFRLFRTVIGIDDSVRETGDVRVEIKGDGKILWQGEVRGSDPARELELEIGGVKRVEILADYGAGLDIGDRLDLCDARVTK